MANTQITDEQFAKFKADAKTLYRHRRYKYGEMAKLLKMGPGNFSSYRSGKKRPGEEFLLKFYTRFGKDLEELQGKAPTPYMFEDPYVPYGSPPKSLSPSDIDEMRAKLDKVISDIGSLQKDITLLLKLTKDNKTAGPEKGKKKPGG